MLPLYNLLRRRDHYFQTSALITRPPPLLRLGDFPCLLLPHYLHLLGIRMSSFLLYRSQSLRSMSLHCVGGRNAQLRLSPSLLRWSHAHQRLHRTTHRYCKCTRSRATPTSSNHSISAPFFSPARSIDVHDDSASRADEHCRVI